MVRLGWVRPSAPLLETWTRPPLAIPQRRAWSRGRELGGHRVEAGRRHREVGVGGATLLWDGVGVLMGGGRRETEDGGVSEGWAVGDCLSAQRPSKS